ncbi:MAG: DUF2723 domain-containing protein [Myxococcales bacterium]|nr:DUF2723 domain-containing protein [Myxococcales bacterium]
MAWRATEAPSPRRHASLATLEPQADGATPALHLRAAGAAFLGCLLAYVAGVAPSLYWLDSSEFAAAAFELGVAHPPGHPLAQLLGKACALLPIGSVAFRVGLASAIAGAAAAGLTALLAASVAARVGRALGRSDEAVEALLGAAAGLCFGLSWAAWFQAVRPEVYALHAALVLAAAVELERFERRGDRRHLYSAALAIGLALANHHLLALSFAVAAVLFLLACRPGPGRARGALWVIAAGALGTAVYLYLPLRAARHPEVDWGAPTTLARLFWTVSASAFQRSVANAASSGVRDVAFALLGQLGAAGPLALLGGYLLLRLRATRRLAPLLLGGLLLDATVPSVVGFDPQNPDVYGYLEPAVAFGSCLAAAGAMGLCSFARRPGFARALAAAMLAATAGAARALPETSRARFHDADRFFGAALDDAPPRAALVSSYFQTVFGLWYLQGVEGRRPDVEHVHRHFLPFPGYRDEVLRRSPSLEPILHPHAGRALIALSARRSVLFEYDLETEAALLPHLLPTGRIDRVLSRPPNDATRAHAETEATERVTALALEMDIGEPQTLRALLWLHYLEANRSCALGRLAPANAAIGRARALLPIGKDPELEDLARRCPSAQGAP